MYCFQESIEDFEIRRWGARRNESALCMPPNHRLDLIQRCTDASPIEIQEATLEASRLHQQRLRSARTAIFCRNVEYHVKHMFGFD